MSSQPALHHSHRDCNGSSPPSICCNALQAHVRKRFAFGMEYPLGYTFSKGMTDAQGHYGSPGQAAGTGPYTQNVYNRRAEWRPTRSSTISTTSQARSSMRFPSATGSRSAPVGGGPSIWRWAAGNRAIRTRWGRICRISTLRPIRCRARGFGNAGVGIVRGPGMLRTDLLLNKQFRIAERKYFQLRLAPFNATNTPIFQAPASLVITAPTFGQIDPQFAE
jgi:hypothetical protein